MADLDNKLVTFASLRETVTRLKEYANQFEPRKEVVSKAKLTYATNYIRAYCDYSATIPTTVRVTDDDGSVLLVTGSAEGSWRAVRLIKGETDRFKKVYYSNGYVYIQVDNDSMYTVFGGVLLKVFGSATGTEIPIENAADTDIEIPTSYPADAISYVNDTVGSATVDDALNAVITDLHTHDNKDVLDLLSVSDAGRLQYNGVTIGGGEGGDLTDYQKKTDNTLTTTDKTIVGSINEVNGNLLDTVGFSADYKNIILNRKSGLNPYTIPIAAIINNASLTELKDIDSTDIGNGKTLVYDSSTQKHRYVNTTGTDEFVKMDSTSDAHYLADLIDKQTVVNDNGVLKVKKLDGQEVTITEINYLKGLTMNVMDLVSAFANGGVKVLNTPLNTASELNTMDRSAFIEGISYIVYVLADETHAGAKTTYLCDKTTSTFFGNADSQRNFTTNPIDLANEVTGKLDNSHIDVDNLWTLLTINDTYKTLTATDNVFGTHGAKAMYDELTTEIGGKANTSDLTTHTRDTDIHVTTFDKDKWNKVDEKVNKTDITTTIDSSSTDEQVASAKAIYDELENINDFSVQVVKENLDLNDITETGIYFFPQTYTPVNIPVGVNGWLLVMKGSSSDIVKQVWYRLGTANSNSYNTFERYKGGNTWSEWTKFLTEKEYYNALDYGNPVIPQDADLNDYLTPGVYTCMSSTDSKTLVNCPHIDSNFKLIVNRNRGNSDTFYGYQMIVGTVGGNPVTDVCIYYRGISMYDNVCVFSKWKIMSGSTVADVSKTTLIPVFPSGVVVASGGVGINYVVRNGWCNVNFVFNVTSATTFSWTDIATGLPKPANSANIVLMSEGGKATQPIAIKINSTGSVSSRVPSAISTTDWWTGNISYPVAES